MGRLLSLFVVCLGFAAFSLIANATHSWTDSSGRPYHWAGAGNEFTLMLGDNVSASWDGFLDQAMIDWNVSMVLQTVKVAGGTRPKTCKPTAGQIEVCSERYGYNGWLGIAQIWISSGHITQAITKVNDSYFNTTKYNTPAWRLFVMCEEIGHTFGLDHQDENFNNSNLNSCMDYTSDPISNQHPNGHDYAELEDIYTSHDDSSTSASQASAPNVPPPAMSEIDFEGPGQWGKLVRSTRGDRLQRYELDFGSGHKIFTFVIWADEEDRGRGKAR
jgi:hypothetical protein